MTLWHTLSVKQTLQELSSSSQTGLKEEDAIQRLQTYGANQLDDAKKTSLLHRFIMQFKDFMIITLLVAAAISYISARFGEEGGAIDAFIILAIVCMNAILGVVQEAKAEHSLEALKQMASPKARVLRNKKWQSIPAEQLVPGDIIRLETGDIVPADSRILQSVEMKTQESALTGESTAIKKNATLQVPPDCPLAERANLLLAGTHLAYGHGTAAVVETGMHTELGKIAKMIQSDSAPETPLQRRLASLSKVLGLVALLICMLVFLLGLRQAQNAFSMFLTAVSLAVAAIPEGLPAIVTIMLSLGVQRMAKKNAVIRKLPAVETLGSATVICSDKTGTLTQNQMKVTAVSGLAPLSLQTPQAGKLLQDAVLCSNASTGPNHTYLGEPTEVALLHSYEEDFCIKSNSDFASFATLATNRLRETPFDSNRKRMSVLIADSSKELPYRVIAKGAPESLLGCCTHYEAEDGSIYTLTHAIRQQILAQNQDYAKEALRVLGVASLRRTTLPKECENLEQNLVWHGLIGMIDPPREEVRQCVYQCKQAGILPIMITGDSQATAFAIGKQLGIATQENEVLSGTELNTFSDKELARNIYRYRIFARVTPEHKVRIVKAFQDHGEIVAMTGDGVNDAPALRVADIGCAMGKQGTDVAQGASDMILTDDNFATIVAAIEEGRGIYANIQKAVHFLLSCNIGEILTIFVAILLGLPSPLLPIHLLWVNLITDSFPAIALGREPAEEDNMRRAPRAPSSSIFSGGVGFRITVEGLMIGGLALLAYLIGIHYGTGDSSLQGATMCFAVLGLSQLFHSFNMRSSRSLRHIGFFKNPALIFSFVLCVILQLSVMTIPSLQTIFHTTPLSLTQWGIILILSIFPILLVELEKKSA